MEVSWSFSCSGASGIYTCEVSIKRTAPRLTWRVDLKAVEHHGLVTEKGKLIVQHKRKSLGPCRGTFAPQSHIEVVSYQTWINKIEPTTSVV